MAAERNLAQISYACTSPLMSDTSKYPTVRNCMLSGLRGMRAGPGLLPDGLAGLCVVQFFRTVSPSTSYSAAVVELVQAYSWQRTVLLASIGFGFAASAGDWNTALRDAAVETAQIDVTYDQCADPELLGGVLDNVKAKVMKVVMVLAATEDLKRIALRADAMGMVSKGWVWISDSFCARVDDGSNTTAVRTALRSCLWPLRLLIGGWRVCRLLQCGRRSTGGST